MAKKVKEADVKVVEYDVASHSAQGAAPVPPKYSSKETVNLCMKERKSISYETFFIILIIFFAVLLVIEYFGAYLPYREIEQKEKQLAANETELSQLQNSMSDRDQIRADYRQYNYENFPRNIVDRAEILALLERTVFERGKITSVNISSNNTVVLNVADVSRDDLEAMQKEIREDELVFNVFVSRTNLEDGESAGVTMTIVFNDPSEGR